MATEKLKTPQALADARRRDRQFQVRLSIDLASKVRSYQKENGLNENQVMQTIINHFFTNHA